MDDAAERVRRARLGDKAAFGELVEAYRTMVVRLAYRMIGDDEIARDLAQEAMLRAYLSLRYLRDDGAFKSWLYGIALNVCRGYLREQQHAPLSLEALAGGLRWEGDLPDPAPSVEEIAEARALHRRVLRAIHALTHADREAVLLYYFDGLTTREAAAVLGITPGALRVRLHKARTRLRQHLLPAELQPMRQEEPHMIPVRVSEVLALQRKVEWQETPLLHYIVLLLDETGGRILPIWIGTSEGQAILLAQQQPRPFNRPMTLDFMRSLVEAAGAQVESVAITRLADDVYYAVTRLQAGDATHEIDARPSDAIGLAVATNAPLLVAEDVLDAASVPVGVRYADGRAERERQRTPLAPPSAGAPAVPADALHAEIASQRAWVQAIIAGEAAE